ncbi:MAG: tetratricopeptide repeat protein [Chloroflexota bacterium]|nr:tetratricopeptide repeat protein [Chloroflexota bacterium]
MAAINKALELRPKDRFLLETRGDILALMTRYEEALSAYDEALAEAPDDYVLWDRKARMHHKLHNLEACEEALMHAVDLTSDQEDPAVARAHARYQSALSLLARRGQCFVWWEWWFAEGSKARKASAAILLLLLSLFLIAPLVVINTDRLKQSWYLWPNAGASWEVFLVPVAAIGLLLLSPMLVRVGPGGLELGPIEKSREQQERDLGKLLESPEEIEARMLRHHRE